MSKSTEKITLGSGHLYVIQFTGAVPAFEIIEQEANRLGWIKGGAEVSYSGEWYEAKDDLGHISKTLLTGEEVSLKSGILTWCGKTLKYLCSTARVTESNGHRKVKIGGVGNQDGRKYIIHFLHEDAESGDVRVTIVGKNQAGFTMAFAADDETVIDAEFKAEPCDKSGTLLMYDEQMEANGLTIKPAAGTATGTTKLTVTPAKASGNTYAYAVNADIPFAGNMPGDSFAVWDGTADITIALTGDTITVLELDTTGAVVKAGQCETVVKA
ncbi:MAG: hypothetical protein RR998_08345 [Oscillospiraceae bacterium]